MDKKNKEPKKEPVVKQSDKNSLAINLQDAIAGVKDFDSLEIREFKKNMKTDIESGKK